MTSSTRSDVFSLLSILVICTMTLFLLRYFLPLRSTKSYLLVPVFLALALPASIVLLVPIDLASSAGTDTGTSRGIWLPEKTLLVAWRITYWLTFLLTWLILPLLGGFCNSGYRKPADRIMNSLRSNFKHNLIVLAAATVGGIYFFVQAGFRFTSLKALIMALAYAWGLILAIYLMGHGLVSIPRRLFRNASVAGKLKRLQADAPRIEQHLSRSVQKVDEYESQVLQLYRKKHGMSWELQAWVGELYSRIGLPESGNIRTSSSTIPQVVTERYLATLTRNLKRAHHKRSRYLDEWDRLICSAKYYKAVIDSENSKKLEFEMPIQYGAKSSVFSQISYLMPTIRYYTHTHVIPFCFLVLGFAATFTSIAIIWSELVKSLDPKLSIVGLSVVHHPRSDRGQIGVGGQILGAFFLVYMVTCALTSVTEVKVWGNRALVRRNTYSESACWYATQVAKLTVPLAYDFLTFVPPNIYKNTVFYNFLGKLINLTPLGKSFSGLFPMLVLLPVLATLFGLYGKIKKIFGFDALEDDEDHALWKEGKIIIDRELREWNASALALRRTDESTDNLLSSANRGTTALRNKDRRDIRHSSRDRHYKRPQISVISGEEGISDGGDESFFGDFAHRVKNTIDTTELPAWFKTPKWMPRSDARAAIHSSRNNGRVGNTRLNVMGGGNNV